MLIPYRSGRYHEDVIINGKHGDKGNPIIIAAYENESPIIDGSVVLKPRWSRYKGRIFKGKIETDIWQLFLDKVMMTNARWPNSLWSDYTIFNNSFWGKSALNSTPSNMIDNGDHDLAGSGINATDAMAILNIGSFNTFVAKVISSSKGSFTYNNTFHSDHFKPKLNQYFLEDKLELLDQPGEWFYDKTSKTVYVWSLDGKNPKSKEVRGKNQTYAFTITDSRYVVFKNLIFFATTLHAYTESSIKYIDHLEFVSLNFSFPSYSKRMLGNPNPPIWTKIIANKGYHVTKRFKIFNCTFYGTDGAALQYSGNNVTLENNLFEYNDWSGAMMSRSTGGMGTIISQGTEDRFIRNTLQYNGASAGLRYGMRLKKLQIQL